MYMKKLVILVVIFLFFIISVNSQNIFQCEDGTIFGECNDGGSLCVGDHNNIGLRGNMVVLAPNTEYLFFAEPIQSCHNPRLVIGSREMNLVNTGRMIVGQFISENEEFSYIGRISIYIVMELRL